MFIGHIGIGLALKSVEPKINVGTYIFASLLLDILLGLFVLMGIESITVPENYSQIHYLYFSFPYSHSLIAAVFWSLLLGGGSYMALRFNRRLALKVAVLLSMAVFFHWVCDWLEHPPQLPVFGNNSSMLGLGLWNNLAAALTVEMLLVIVGIVLYLRVTKNIGSKARIGMILLMTVLSGVAVMGQLMVAQVPEQIAVAVSMVAQALVVCGLVTWIDRPRVNAV